MKWTIALLLISLSSRASNGELPPELRESAPHDLRTSDKSLELGQAEVLASELSSRFPSPFKMTSCYRGDEKRAGFSGGLLSPANLKLEWRVPFINTGIHTASKASPAVDSSGIYVGSDTSWFYSYDLKGHLNWRRFVPNSPRGIHCTAVLDQKKAYFGAYNGFLYALGKKDGKLIWSEKLGDSIGSSPVIFQNDIFISVERSNPLNGIVTRVSAMNGKLIWKSQDLGEQIHSSPVINEKAGLVYVGTNGGIFYGLDLENGQIRWKFTDGKPIKSTSALVGDSVFFGSWSGKVYRLDANTGKKEWEADLGFKSRTSPTYVPGLDYLVVATENGNLSALRLKDGSRAWELKTGVDNFISSSLAMKKSDKKNDWVVWDTCEKYILCALDAGSGAVLGKYDMQGLLTSVPVYFKNRLYLSLDRDGGLESFRSSHPSLVP